MSVQFFPVAGTGQSALEMQAVLAASVMHLFQSSLVPDPSTPLSAYTAAEADYDEYAAVTMTTWNDPILAPGSGYMIGSPLVQFAVGDEDPSTPNIIGGAYIVDSAGVLRMTIIFTVPANMQIAGQGIPLNVYWLFPTGV